MHDNDSTSLLLLSWHVTWPVILAQDDRCGSSLALNCLFKVDEKVLTNQCHCLLLLQGYDNHCHHDVVGIIGRSMYMCPSFKSTHVVLHSNSIEKGLLRGIFCRWLDLSWLLCYRCYSQVVIDEEHISCLGLQVLRPIWTWKETLIQTRPLALCTLHEQEFDTNQVDCKVNTNVDSV